MRMSWTACKEDMRSKLDYLSGEYIWSEAGLPEVGSSGEVRLDSLQRMLYMRSDVGLHPGDDTEGGLPAGREEIRSEDGLSSGEVIHE